MQPNTDGIRGAAQLACLLLHTLLIGKEYADGTWICWCVTVTLMTEPAANCQERCGSNDECCIH